MLISECNIDSLKEYREIKNKSVFLVHILIFWYIFVVPYIFGRHLARKICLSQKRGREEAPIETAYLRRYIAHPKLLK
jgi:hypothetical protein